MIYSLENELWRESNIKPGINFEGATLAGTAINALILKETEEEKRLDELDRKVPYQSKTTKKSKKIQKSSKSMHVIITEHIQKIIILNKLPLDKLILFFFNLDTVQIKSNCIDFTF